MSKLTRRLKSLIWEEYKEKGLTYSDGRKNGIKRAIVIVEAWEKKHLLTAEELEDIISLNFSECSKVQKQAVKKIRAFATKECLKIYDSKRDKLGDG